MTGKTSPNYSSYLVGKSYMRVYQAILDEKLKGKEKMLRGTRKIFSHLVKNLKPHVYVVSYPKTGRTWIRLLIGKALSEKYNIPEEKMLRARYMTSAAGVSRTRFIHDGSATDQRKAYYEFSADKSEYKNYGVILLARDVKDTLVSSYFQATKREAIFKGSLSDFIRSDHFGAMKILTFYKQWYDQRHIPADFLFIRYEDLHKKPEDELRKVLGFLGDPGIEDDVIKKAVEYCRFDNLRGLEMERKFNSGILTPKDINDPESFKTRKGVIGNYKQYFEKSDIEYIDEQINEFGCEFTRPAML